MLVMVKIDLKVNDESINQNRNNAIVEQLKRKVKSLTTNRVIAVVLETG